MADLRECPFCGGDCLYKTFEVNDLGDEIPVIFCNECKIVFKVENDSPFLDNKKTYEYLEEKNANAWNTRKPMEAVVAELEASAEGAKDSKDLSKWSAYKQAISIVRGKE